MLYEAKGKAYEYIKGVLDAEEKEYQAYMKRVEEAVGFEFEKWQGYQPNRSLLREHEITAIWVHSERYETLDKKVWKKCDGKMLEDGYYVAIGTLYVMKDVRDRKLVLPIYVILGFCGLCIMLLYTMAIQGRVNV